MASNQRERCQDQCQARCCRYITVQIPAPKRKCDLDELSWFLAHEQVSVYVESRRWHLEVRTRCRYLTANCLCAIYATRPEVCREYHPEKCEYPARPKHRLEFDQMEDFDAWREKQRQVRSAKRRARARPNRADDPGKGDAVAQTKCSRGSQRQASGPVVPDSSA